MKENMKVAVIGSGVTGLGAAWHLSRSHGYEVTVFEAEDKAGGHTETVTIPVDGGKNIDVDIGFIVFNRVRKTISVLNLSCIVCTVVVVVMVTSILFML